ncbi:hypothetical protein ACFY36_04320 [Actinoplanes sp. NPDC000266]
MIPGLGAGVRLVRGVHQKKQIESRIEELTRLGETPAVAHYEGLKRFEVATLICDAHLGVVIDAKAGRRKLRRACDHYLTVMKKEYDMVLEEASGATATKAEVYALGLALKEVALSFDDATAEFTAKSDAGLARLRTELDGNRQRSSAALAEFAGAARSAVDQIAAAGNGRLAELDGQVTARLTEIDREVQDRLARMDAARERGDREVAAALQEIRSSDRALKTMILVAGVVAFLAAVLTSLLIT